MGTIKYIVVRANRGKKNQRRRAIEFRSRKFLNWIEFKYLVTGKL